MLIFRGVCIDHQGWAPKQPKRKYIRCWNGLFRPENKMVFAPNLPFFNIYTNGGGEKKEAPKDGDGTWKM